jgi:transposase InsO family protein
MKPHYQKAKRAERSRLLTDMEEVTGLHRKSLLRLLHASSLNRKKRTTPRKRIYGLAVEQAILVVWESLDYVCAERLTPVLLSTAQHLARFGSVCLTSEVEQQMEQISEATITRCLRKHRARKQRLPRKGPERANQVRKAVPMKRIPWDTTEPGHEEVDLVHHGGESAAGEYAHTIQLIDVATGWSERVAVLGRGQTAMEAGFRRILERIPFPILELHPDNGSEFFNQHLVRFWKDKVTGVQLSRSRPYHKNDNRFVEQKNATLVREYFGTQRLDTTEQVAAMNVLFEQMWLYYNLFQPVLHLIEKQVQPDGIVRKWDKAQTPYQRLLASGKLKAEQHTRLQTLYEQTNPLHLREQIYQGLAALLDNHAACTQGVA